MPLGKRSARHLLSLFMVPIACSAVLFDLDGVLVDSTPAVVRVWTKWATAHGFDPQEVVHRAHGRPSISTIRDYLPNADHELENLVVLKGEIEDLAGVVALPGARQLLTALPSGRWTIVTSCERPLAEVRIRAGGLPLPERLVTSSDITNGKPHPEPYLKGARVLGVAIQDCLVFEDVPAGIRSGKDAGARVVGFRTTVQDAELKAAGADWIADNCSAITLAAKPKPSQPLELQLDPRPLARPNLSR
jgi:mannitol-1-/sugar-/sorbitol-6-phosphatase